MKYKAVLDQTMYHLQNLINKLENPLSQAFGFELVSFIQAGRNVTFCLQEEFSDNPKFKNWYLLKQEEMRKDPLMKFFHDKRNVIVKRGSAGFSAFTFMIEVKALSVPAGGFVKIDIPFESLVSSNDDKIKVINDKGEEIFFGRKTTRTPIFPELEGKHVIEACKEYFIKITSLVEEWEKINSTTSPQPS